MNNLTNIESQIRNKLIFLYLPNSLISNDNQRFELPFDWAYEPASIIKKNLIERKLPNLDTGAKVVINFATRICVVVYMVWTGDARFAELNTINIDWSDMLTLLDSTELNNAVKRKLKDNISYDFSFNQEKQLRIENIRKSMDAEYANNILKTAHIMLELPADIVNGVV